VNGGGTATVSFAVPAFAFRREIPAADDPAGPISQPVSGLLY